jgi:hypothetical protein
MVLEFKIHVPIYVGINPSIYIYICYKYANRYISLSVYSLKRLFWVIFTKHIFTYFYHNLFIYKKTTNQQS